MKGISAVIATILLLLIVIAIVGFAFGFFQRIFTTTSSSVENATSNLVTQAALRVTIDNAAGSSVVIRNVGTANIAPSSITFYVNNQLATCSFGAVPPATIAPNSVANCTLTSPSSCIGLSVRVTTPSGEDTEACR
jgi:flagellin-like protein